MKHDNNIVDKQNQKKAQEPTLNNYNNFEIYDNLEEYKIHIELLARDLMRNKKLQNL
jgi:hypothetical protein